VPALGGEAALDRDDAAGVLRVRAGVMLERERMVNEQAHGRRTVSRSKVSPPARNAGLRPAAGGLLGHLSERARSPVILNASERERGSRR
jgi:hypothetical protein